MYYIKAERAKNAREIMNKYIVSKKNIDLMIHGLELATGEKTPEEKNILGQILWDENFKSVNHIRRYSDSLKSMKYEFTKPERHYSLYEIYKTCRCYNYQSCETKEYDDSEAKAIIDKIYLYIENSLGMDLEKIQKQEEYRAAGWGI